MLFSIYLIPSFKQAKDCSHNWGSPVYVSVYPTWMSKLKLMGFEEKCCTPRTMRALERHKREREFKRRGRGKGLRWRMLNTLRFHIFKSIYYLKIVFLTKFWNLIGIIFTLIICTIWVHLKTKKVSKIKNPKNESYETLNSVHNYFKVISAFSTVDVRTKRGRGGNVYFGLWGRCHKSSWY
jgi:hypothetical protein